MTADATDELTWRIKALRFAFAQLDSNVNVVASHLRGEVASFLQRQIVDLDKVLRHARHWQQLQIRASAELSRLSPGRRRRKTTTAEGKGKARTRTKAKTKTAEADVIALQVEQASEQLRQAFQGSLDYRQLRETLAPARDLGLVLNHFLSACANAVGASVEDLGGTIAVGGSGSIAREKVQAGGRGSGGGEGVGGDSQLLMQQQLLQLRGELKRISGEEEEEEEEKYIHEEEEEHNSIISNGDDSSINGSQEKRKTAASEEPTSREGELVIKPATSFTQELFVGAEQRLDWAFKTGRRPIAFGAEFFPTGPCPLRSPRGMLTFTEFGQPDSNGCLVLHPLSRFEDAPLATQRGSFHTGQAGRLRLTWNNNHYDRNITGPISPSRPMLPPMRSTTAVSLWFSLAVVSVSGPGKQSQGQPLQASPPRGSNGQFMFPLQQQQALLSNSRLLIQQPPQQLLQRPVTASSMASSSSRLSAGTTLTHESTASRGSTLSLNLAVPSMNSRPTSSRSQLSHHSHLAQQQQQGLPQQPQKPQTLQRMQMQAQVRNRGRQRGEREEEVWEEARVMREALDESVSQAREAKAEATRVAEEHKMALKQMEEKYELLLNKKDRDMEEHVHELKASLASAGVASAAKIPLLSAACASVSASATAAAAATTTTTTAATAADTAAADDDADDDAPAAPVGGGQAELRAQMEQQREELRMLRLALQHETNAREALAQQLQLTAAAALHGSSDSSANTRVKCSEPKHQQAEKEAEEERRRDVTSRAVTPPASDRIEKMRDLWGIDDDDDEGDVEKGEDEEREANEVASAISVDGQETLVCPATGKNDRFNAETEVPTHDKPTIAAVGGVAADAAAARAALDAIAAADEYAMLTAEGEEVTRLREHVEGIESSAAAGMLALQQCERAACEDALEQQRSVSQLFHFFFTFNCCTYICT